MFKKLQYIMVLTGLLVLGGLSGCATKSEDDTKITERVNEKLVAEPTLMTSPELTIITVETKDGVVTLIGTVETPTQEQKAKDVAGSVDGVKQVKSELKVQPKNTSTSTTTTTTTTTVPMTKPATTDSTTTPAAPEQPQ